MYVAVAGVVAGWDITVAGGDAGWDITVVGVVAGWDTTVAGMVAGWDIAVAGCYTNITWSRCRWVVAPRCRGAGLPLVYNNAFTSISLSSGAEIPATPTKWAFFFAFNPPYQFTTTR